MMELEELGERKAELLKELRAKKESLKLKASEKRLRNEIKDLEKALKGPSNLEKINLALKNGKVKEKGASFLDKASKLYEKVAEYAEKIDPTEAITGKKTKKKVKK